jgi:hypothetical protein
MTRIFRRVLIAVFDEWEYSKLPKILRRYSTHREYFRRRVKMNEVLCDRPLCRTRAPGKLISISPTHKAAASVFTANNSERNVFVPTTIDWQQSTVLGSL